MKIKLFHLLIASFLFSFSSQAQNNDYPFLKDPSSAAMNVPKGWILTGTNVQDYEVGIDNSDNISGQSSAYLKSSSSKPVGYATLLQEIKGDNYRGERVRLSAHVKTELISDWAALWMKVEDQYKRILSFDNMQDRLLRGTSDWQQLDIVLDVPYNSESITIGITLSGKGEAWLDNVKLLVVNKEVPLTDMAGTIEKNFYPVNPDFEE